MTDDLEPCELDDDDDLALEGDDDIWTDDDPVQPLPVIGPDGKDEPKPKRARLRNAPPPKRANARLDDLSEERAANRSEASGRLVDPTDPEWRQALRDGNRNRASTLLTDGELTHNSGSGFGLA